MLQFIMIFLVGSIFGSFYNVVGLRVPIGKSIIKPRSHCTSCCKELTFIELIPIFSFVFQKGKCRNCHYKIRITYPIIEFLTGCLFLIAFYRLNHINDLIQAFLLISLLMIIVVSDLAYMLIPNKILLLFFIFLSFNKLLFFKASIISSIICMFCLFLLLFIFSIVTKGGIGGGDVKLLSLLAFVFPYPSIFILFMTSCIAGTIIGAILRLTNQIKKNDPIPFGPFIAFSTFFTYFFDQQLLNIYRAVL